METQVHRCFPGVSGLPLCKLDFTTRLSDFLLVFAEFSVYFYILSECYSY